MISGSYESLMRLLEEVFEAGYIAGFHKDIGHYSYSWEDYKKTLDI
jgi:hypothetical protein